MCTTRSVFLTIHRFEKFLDGVDDASSDTDSVLCFLNSTIGDLAEVMHGISGELHRDYESTLWLCNASPLMSSPQADKEMEVQPAYLSEPIPTDLSAAQALLQKELARQSPSVGHWGV